MIDYALPVRIRACKIMHCQSVSHKDLDEIRRESCQDKEKEERGKYDDYD